MRKKTSRKGFTIVELVIVIAVIAILASVLVPVFGDVISNQVAGRGSYASKGSLGALYFHDSVGAAGNSYIIVKNCTIKAELENAICPYTLYDNASYPNAVNNKVYCTFINNTIDGEIWDRNGNAFEKNFILTEESCGNTSERLNYAPNP